MVVVVIMVVVMWWWWCGDGGGRKGWGCVLGNSRNDKSLVGVSRSCFGNSFPNDRWMAGNRPVSTIRRETKVKYTLNCEKYSKKNTL